MKFYLCIKEIVFPKYIPGSSHWGIRYQIIKCNYSIDFVFEEDFISLKVMDELEVYWVGIDWLPKFFLAEGGNVYLSLDYFETSLLETLDYSFVQ